MWNELPADVTSSPSLPVFRQRLKTFLFRRSYPGIVVQQFFLDFRTCHCFVVLAVISYLGHAKPFYDDADDDDDDDDDDDEIICSLKVGINTKLTKKDSWT